MASRQNQKRGTCVDLFSGCGGFSLGAEFAGFHSLVAIDIDPTLQSAYRRNFPRTKVVQASVADIDSADWAQFLGSSRPDAVIGGPPCQGFSWIGKRQKDDPRNSLVHHFYRHVSALRPRFFIMENVEGLLHDSNRALLDSAIETVSGSYKIVGPFVVNAAHFGAATSRRRVVVVGYDSAEIDELDERVLNPSAPKSLATVREAISDLPSPIPEHEDETGYGWVRYRTKQEIASYARKLRRRPPEGLGWAQGIRLYTDGYISGGLSTAHSSKVAKRYASIDAGKTDWITKSFRLDWNGQCPTLRAGTGADKGAFQAVRPLHPSKGRVITVREAARLQGFPDWFVFHPTKWHSFRMLGNSVSPFVSQGLFAKIARRMHVSLA